MRWSQFSLVVMSVRPTPNTTKRCFQQRLKKSCANSRKIPTILDFMQCVKFQKVFFIFSAKKCGFSNNHSKHKASCNFFLLAKKEINGKKVVTVYVK